MRNLLLTLMLCSGALLAQAGVTINAADYGIVGAKDATPALLDAIEAAHEKRADHLVIPKGIYHFYPERAFQKYCAISNNDNGMKHIALPLIGFDGLTVDAQGSEFIMHGQMMAIVIEESTDVVVENLTIDWDQPLHIQGEVVAVNAGANSFDLQVLEENNVAIEEGVLINTEIVAPPDGGKLDNWWTPWKQDMAWSFVFDAKTKATHPDYGSGSPLSARGFDRKGYRAEKLGHNRFRLFNATSKQPEVGMALVAKGMLRPNRISPAIRVFQTFGLTMRDVTVHHAGGMGLIGERAGDITLERFRVRLREGTQRVISTTADATHFVGCKGLIKFEDCYFENMLDDATNVHGTYTRVAEQRGPRTVLAKLMHFQQFGFVFAEAGDLIRFSTQAQLEPFAEATATAVRWVNDQFMEITFDRDIGELLDEPVVLDNLSWQADVHMRNTTVSRNRARSLLLSTAGDILIENNTFDRSSMMNILLEGDANVWHESNGVRNVRIVGNHFIDTNPMAEMIRISPLFKDKSVVLDKPYHRNIVIEGNTFETLSPYLMQAAHSAELIFRNNKIVRAKGFQAGDGKQAAYELTNCQDFTIEGNDNQLGVALKLEQDTRSHDIEFSDN